MRSGPNPAYLGFAGETDTASAATCDIGAAPTDKVRITGTTTITSFGTVPNVFRMIRFAGALTLTHNGTSLVLPGALNRTTAAGDAAIATSDASGNWRVHHYMPGNGRPLETGQSTVASAATADIGAVLSKSITVSGTTTITSFGSSAPDGDVKFVQFSGALLLTHNGTSLIMPGAINRTTVAGDCLIARHEGSGNWRVLGYFPGNIPASGLILQNSQSGAYTTVLSDNGKHILHPSADTTARTFTIDSNANVPHPIGAAITFVNQNSAGSLTIAITSDTMRLAGAGTTGNRTLAANGVATALKITSTEWIISGAGLT